MTFSATAVRVLIASPSDTGEAREVVRATVEDWNSLNAEHHSVVLLPTMWERDAVPEMGEEPQEIINRQLVDRSDILIGIFWTRLGTPTNKSESGTVEEIEKFIESGRPVVVYFSNQPVAPESIDPEEHKRVIRFRESLRSRGLFDSYNNLQELARKVEDALTRIVRERFQGTVAGGEVAATVGPSARPIARIDVNESVRFDSKGKPRTSRDYRLVVENRGTAVAEDLQLSFRGADADKIPGAFGLNEPIGRLIPGGEASYPLLVHMGTERQWDILMRWREGEKEFEEVQTLTL